MLYYMYLDQHHSTCISNILDYITYNWSLTIWMLKWLHLSTVRNSYSKYLDYIAIYRIYFNKRNLPARFFKKSLLPSREGFMWSYWLGFKGRWLKSSVRVNTNIRQIQSPKSPTTNRVHNVIIRLAVLLLLSVLSALHRSRWFYFLVSGVHNV